MKLILVWNEEKKEMQTDLTLDFDKFKEQVKTILDLQGDISISFIDADDDVVEVADKYDLEYMISNSSEEKPLEIKITGNKIDKKEEIEKKELSAIEIKQQEEDIKKCQIEIEQEIIDSIKNTVNNKIDQLERKIKLEKNISVETLPLDHIKDDEPNFDGFFEDKEKNDFDFLIKENSKLKSSIKKPKINKNCALDMAIDNNNRIQELESKVDLIWNEFVNKMNNINKVVNNKKSSDKNQYTPQIHEGYYCDNCKKENFAGKRYSCLECEDLDLCEECEDEIQHYHPMIRYQQPVSTNRSQQMNSLFKSQFITNKNSQKQKLSITKALFGDRFTEDFYEKFVENFGSCNSNMFVNKMSEILK